MVKSNREITCSDLTAGEATPIKAQGGMDFSAAPIPAIRKVLEVVG